MMYNTYILIALAIAGQASALQDGATESAAAEPYAYGYEAPDHAAAEERKPDGTVQGYYTLKDADGRSRRVNYVADESGFHANVETNEHGTKTSNPADAVVVASPANPEQLVYRQQAVQQVVQPQVVQQPRVVQAQVVQQPQVVRQQQVQYGYQYQPGYGYGSSYGVGYPGSAGYGYTYAPSSSYYSGVSGYPSSSSSYYQSNGAYYQPGSSYTYGYGTPGYGYGSNYGNGNAVYGGNYNYHTPASYYSAVRTSAVKPAVSVVNRQVSSGIVPVSSSSLTGSSNYAIIQKRDVEATKPSEASKQEKASPEKPGQEKKTN